jgi:hypothetical protein
VRGVAGQEDPPGPEAVRDAMVEGKAGSVAGLADGRGAGHVAVDHRLGVRDRRLVPGAVVTEEQPLPPVRKRHGPEPVGVEEHRKLAGVVGPALHERVHHGPAPRVVAALERDTQRLAQAAVDAVTRHQEAGPDRRVTHLRPHTVRILAREPERRSSLHRRLEPLLQERLQIALAQADRRRERAVDAAEVKASDLPSL